MSLDTNFLDCPNSLRLYLYFNFFWLHFMVQCLFQTFLVNSIKHQDFPQSANNWSN